MIDFVEGYFTSFEIDLWHISQPVFLSNALPIQYNIALHCISLLIHLGNIDEDNKCVESTVQNANEGCCCCCCYTDHHNQSQMN